MAPRVHAVIRSAVPALLLALLASPAAPATCPPVSLMPAVQYPTSTGPNEVAVADFTGDGIPDIAVTEFDLGAPQNSRISVFPGQTSGGLASGTFGARIDTPLAGRPLDLAKVDLNGDGILDLVVSNWDLDAVQVLLGTGGGHFSLALTTPAGSKPYEVTTGDWNGDGVPDVAVADNAEAAVSVLIAGRDGSGHWDGTFGPPVAYATADLSLAIVAGDFNNDGVLDLVATEYLAGTVAVFLGNVVGGAGDGTFRAAVHIPAGPEPYDLATGDFNADGRLDLLVDDSSNGGVHVLLGSASGFFPVDNAYLAGVNCSGVSVADLDGDGVSDLLVSSAVTNTLYLLRGLTAFGKADGTFDAPVTLGDCCFPVHVQAADLDLDGRPDAVTCDHNNNAVAVFLDGCVPDARRPVIARIRDVPNDQGGKVFITWTASSLDAPGGPVNSYRVWRQVPPAVAAARAMSATRAEAPELRLETRTNADGTLELVYWEALATLPAQRLAGYGYTAATPSDSLPTANPLFTYRISALTSNIDVFYDSDPDSGYSVDNLAPAAPAAFAALRSGGAAQLTWSPSPEADVVEYRLYRSYDPSFAPTPQTLLATLTSPGYTDPEGASASYELTAVDSHGNASPCASALAATTAVPPGGPPGTTWLAPPAPNPMRVALDVRFALAHGGRVSLVLFDQQGRIVRTLMNGARPAGEASARWDARDDAGRAVRAGLYFLEMETEGRRLVRRVTLVR